MRKGISFIKPNPHVQSEQLDKNIQQKPTVADVVVKKRLVEEIISRVDDLPALPTVVCEIIKLIEDENSNASNFEKYLKQDQSLTARLLKMVNSSFFGLRNKVNTIPEAIVIIGYNSLKNLVLAASTSKLLQGAFPGYGFKERGLWQHSFMSGMWTKKIAKDLGFDAQQAEELFVAGLLHDIGKLVLSNYISEKIEDMIQLLIKNGGDVEEAERTLFGIDHSEIGSRIAQKWNFSNKLSNIINYHHRVDSAYDYQREISLVHLVNYMMVKGQFGMFENFPVKKRYLSSSLKHLKILDTSILDDYQEQIDKSAKRWDEIDV